MIKKTSLYVIKRNCFFDVKRARYLSFPHISRHIDGVHLRPLLGLVLPQTPGVPSDVHFTTYFVDNKIISMFEAFKIQFSVGFSTNLKYRIIYLSSTNKLESRHVAKMQDEFIGFLGKFQFEFFCEGIIALNMVIDWAQNATSKRSSILLS